MLFDYPEQMFHAPLAEVSGACFVGNRLVIVGDAEPVLAWADWTGDGPGEWTTLDVSALPDAPGETGQFEAVEHLRGSTVVILCEEPALLLAVDLDAGAVAGIVALEGGPQGSREVLEEGSQLPRRGYVHRS